MRIVTADTIFDHPGRYPAAQSLTMRASRPIIYLLGMTLGTKLVAVIEPHCFSVQRMQGIHVAGRVTGHTVHHGFPGVLQLDLPM